MKILTLNSWQERGPWQERWKIILEGLERYQPDLIGFQELFNASWAEEVQKKTGYQTLVFPKEFCGLAIYSKYPVLSWGIEKLSQSPLEEYLRYALWAELKIGAEKFVLFNTHLSWKLEDGATRQKQAEEILQLIEEKAGDRESILVGDLNAPPDSPEISQLIREGEFLDPFHKLHPKEAGLSWDNRNPYAGGAEHHLPDRRIDYILARGSGPLFGKPISCGLVFSQPNPQGIWATDHFGFLTEFMERGKS